MKSIKKVVVAAVATCALAVMGCSLVGCGSSNGDLVTEGTLTVGTSPDYPPFENLVDGEIVGFEADLAQALADEMGLKLEFKQMQFDTIQPAVIAGGQIDCGIAGFSVTPERAEEVDFTDPTFTDDMAVAVMSGSTITSDNAKTELNKAGIIIAVQTGTTGENYAKENFPNATIKGFGNSTDCFAAMQAGKANAVCTNLSVVGEMLGDAYPDATIVYKDATDEDYGIIVSKDNPDLTAALNEALQSLKDSGKLDEITNKWFS